MPNVAVVPNANIQFNDGPGNNMVACTAMRFSNWSPDAEDIGPSPVALGTGNSYKFIERTDYTATFDLDHIPPLSMNTVMRLKRWLESGGQITVNTQDLYLNSYTCVLKPKGKVTWKYDKKLMEYSVSVAVKNTAAAYMRCIYSPIVGTGYLLAITPNPIIALAGVGPSTLTATLTDPFGNVVTGLPVQWYSNNTFVATVAKAGASTATLTPVAPGFATIYATCGGIVATAAVTVNSNLVPASIVLSPTPTVAFTATTYTGVPTVGVSGVPAIVVAATIKNSGGSTIAYSAGALTWSTSDATKVKITDNGDGTCSVIPLQGSISGVTVTAKITANLTITTSVNVTSVAAAGGGLGVALVPTLSTINFTGVGQTQAVSVVDIDQYGVTVP
jgi:hypothetical protein